MSVCTRHGLGLVRQGLRQNVSQQRLLWSTEHEVPNTGSVVRDILATERTFLAWARTGLGFVGAGSALATAYHRERQQQQQPSTPVLQASALLIANGGFLLAFATRRYWTVLKVLKNDRFPMNAASTLAAVCFTSVNTLAALAIVWKSEMESGDRKTESRSKL